MPIDFEDTGVDVGGVDDRRGAGRGGAVAIGGGTGIVGLIIFLLYSLVGGGSGQAPVLPIEAAPQAGSSTETYEQLSERCNRAGALDEYTDCRLIKVYNVADDVWRAEFARRGIEYSRPRLAFFDSSTQTGCGPAGAEVGPFYCPADQEIYFELGFLDVLQQKFGASGDFAQAYIAAHEFGHHLQTLLGIEPQVRRIQQTNPSLSNEFSVAMELQADCFAGVWAELSTTVEGNSIRLTEQNIADAVEAAQAVGDDRIQAKVQGRVDPESWTHGSAVQRERWFTTGLASGDIDSCNTFQYYKLTS